ncbi:hypothetical protein IEE91_07495 [Kocuria sp. cx-455]|uniref:hypothetical protein n=1 Tax=Kocuria sp. cx-455 TaxID=2771377 RepID=UPI00168893EE|nr:hypothetical protein [Kocuria sp. cx-455]MBD2765030.1 hypothetical protein [Kocuria sp. cx-455]
MSAHDMDTVITTDVLGRRDAAVASELVGGRLELCGHTWQIPVRPHWSEDPFKDFEWRRQYQSLSWLTPLRRRAVSGDLNALQAWWWLAATWLESLDRLEPGQATPWRMDVASVRACELVAGLSAVGRQPWLLAAITTHSAWLDATAGQSESSGAHPVTLAARYVCHRTVGDTATADECLASLADWRANHFSQVGAPYPDTANFLMLGTRAIDTVESCLTGVSAPLPWPDHNQPLAQCLVNTQVERVAEGDVRPESRSDQQVRSFVLETDRAAYASVSGTPTGGGFVGFEESRDGSTVDVSFAHGGRVWLRGVVPSDGAIREPLNSYSVQTTNVAFEIGLDRTSRHGHSERHRLLHSLSSGVTLWESDTEAPFELPEWFKTVDVVSDLTATVSPGSIRLVGGTLTFFLVRLPVPNTSDELAPADRWDPSFRLYVGPWHARLVDVLHQSGPATAQLTTERLSRLAGPPEPDGDLLDVYAGAGWRITSNRTVLRAEQSRVPGAGHLVLTSSNDKHVVTGRGSRSKTGYLDIGNVPHGEYDLMWIPVDGSARRGPRLALTDDSVDLAH